MTMTTQDAVPDTCTKNTPNYKARFHLDSVCVGDEYNGLSGGGDYEIYKCPYCQRKFYVELPD